MNEKEAIEKATSDAFIKLYNSEMGTILSIVEYSDAPDIRCKDQDENVFNFEITLTEDRQGDIRAALGRSDDRNLESFKKHCEEVKAGKANPLAWLSCSQGEVKKIIVSRIQSKLDKDYGPNIALVVRHVSGVDWNWDWDWNREQIVDSLDLERQPFDKGVWVMSSSEDRIFRLL